MLIFKWYPRHRQQTEDRPVQPAPVLVREILIPWAGARAPPHSNFIFIFSIILIFMTDFSQILCLETKMLSKFFFAGPRPEKRAVARKKIDLSKTGFYFSNEIVRKLDFF